VPAVRHEIVVLQQLRGPGRIVDEFIAGMFVGGYGWTGLKCWVDFSSSYLTLRTPFGCAST